MTDPLYLYPPVTASLDMATPCEKHAHRTALLNELRDLLLRSLTRLAGPASASSTTCSSSGNACEYVYNGSAGNPFINRVKVWNPANAGTNETYRLLINGTVIATASGTSGYTFQLNRFFNPGTCIQGGVLGGLCKTSIFTNNSVDFPEY
jgi:hypothetical protein